MGRQLSSLTDVPLQPEPEAVESADEPAVNEAKEVRRSFPDLGGIATAAICCNISSSRLKSFLQLEPEVIEPAAEEIKEVCRLSSQSPEYLWLL